MRPTSTSFTNLLLHRIPLPLLFTFILSQAIAQNRKIDSLRNLLPTLPLDTNRVNTLVLLAREYRNLGDSLTLPYAKEAYNLAETLKFYRAKASAAIQLGRYLRQIERRDEAVKYLQEAISLFEKSGRLNGVASGYNNLGGVYYDQANYALARECYKKSLDLYKKLNDRENIALLTGNVGVTYEGEGNYTKALDAYFQSLKMNEEINYKQGMAYNFEAIAINYDKQEDQRKAIEFHQKALAIYFAENDPFFTAVTQVNMGLAYTKMEEYAKAMEVSNKALLGFRKLRSPVGEADALMNIGQIYLKQQDLSSAASYFRRALRARSQGEDSGRSSDLANLSETYLQMGKADSAVFFGKQALIIAERIKSIPTTLRINKILYETYKLKRDPGTSLRYLEEYMINKDSIFNKEKNAQFKELQIRYETEKKEQEIAILNSDKALQKNKVLLLSVSIAVTLLVIAFLFIAIRSNKRRQHSERLLLDEQLRNKNMEAEKLQELDEIKSRFFANIAHEFRTPLTLISGPVENLLEENRDKYSKDQLLLVKSNSARLLGLINQLLDLSKLESGVTKLELHKENIMTFLKGLAFSFQSLADEKEIALECETSPEELLMDFDKDKMEKIVFNLLSNAFKFTPDFGFIKVSAMQRRSDGADYLEISVTDSGAGILEEELPLIFNRFYQAGVEQIRNSQGSGIGLALTKELVELHGGTICVTSTPGNGTAFLVSLPVWNNANVKASQQEGPSGNDIVHIKQTGNRVGHEESNAEVANPEIVLVIEDNQEVRNFIIDSLKHNYQMIAATNGDEGIAMACDQVPDLIISDVMMPGKSGYDTCRILKGDERTSHIPVILLTAKAGFENKMEGLETGADDFMAKPFSTRELQVRLKNLITTRKKLREKYLDAALSDEKPDETLEDAFLIKIREAIEAHLDNSEFSVEDLCREIGMSRTQVHRKLKALTNQSASQFMRILKLQHGKLLLQEGKYNVSEVADKVGFNSLTYFSSSYATHFGYAPSEEKKR